MRKITLAGVLAVVAVLLIAPAAYAAPSMTVTDVVAPTGTPWGNPDEGWSRQLTTWKVSLSGISAWDTSQCSSTARFANGETKAGFLVNHNQRFWPFSAFTPIVQPRDNPSYDDTYAALSSVTAKCVLEKKTYLGRRPYRKAFTTETSRSSAFQRSGCPIYRYSVGKLTIDCRHSSRSGHASWRFPLRRSDIVLGTWNYFERNESTIGAYNLRAVRSAKSVVLTETVSPGTMITVAEVGVKVSRRHWRAAYLTQKKTLHASWYG